MFNVGDFVKYDAVGGSIGQIESISEHDHECYHVMWSYGLDNFGKQVTAMSRYVRGNNLVSIKRDEWEARRKSKFNSSSETPKLVAEDELSTKYNTPYTSAMPLINAARYLMRTLPFLDFEIYEDLTPTDQFFLHLMQHHYSGEGTHNTLPKDVRIFMYQIHKIADSKKKTTKKKKK